ncbi:hypothetical protein B9J09_06540 [Xylella fastidiosa subsp. pauca]|nr:hypothetical protein B9J09_06540 [Xylella fastidiosa subsp. pauca]
MTLLWVFQLLIHSSVFALPLAFALNLQRTSGETEVPFSRGIGHLLPVACGGSAEYVWAKCT